VNTASLVIRPSRDEDVAFVAPIYAESVRTGTASWEYEPPSVEEFAARRRDILGKGFPYFVAELDGVPVGYSYASSYRARIGYRFTVEDSVYVSPTASGRGVGWALLNTLIDACRAQGLRSMIAVIGDSDNVASIKLHESCGFRTVGVFPELGFKFDRWLDSVQMMRKL
jgi:phosphinothricin acetyltransferase